MDSSFQQRLVYLILALPAFVAAFTIHEFAHAYTADHFGDDTARRAGKLTLDPFKQLNSIGSLFLVVTILMGLPPLGWASVPVNRNNLRNPRRDDILVSAAGPASNLVQAFVWLLLLYIVIFASGKTGVHFSTREMLDILNYRPDLSSAWSGVIAACTIGVTLNFSLAAFNMLPIPPFDGGNIVQNLVPELAPIFNAIRPMSFLIIFFLINYGNLLSPLFTPVERASNGLVISAFGFNPKDFFFSQ